MSAKITLVPGLGGGLKIIGLSFFNVITKGRFTTKGGTINENIQVTSVSAGLGLFHEYMGGLGPLVGFSANRQMPDSCKLSFAIPALDRAAR
jgi:hypothetical protein